MGAAGHLSAHLGVAWLTSCRLQAQNEIDVPSVARLVVRKLRNFVLAIGRRCRAHLPLGRPTRLAVLEACDGIELPGGQVSHRVFLRGWPVGKGPVARGGRRFG